MTDNGSCYKAFDFRDACQEIGLKHKRTKPYTPKTNGKAERFIQTSLREWAYAQAYNTSNERAAELPRWHQKHGRGKIARAEATRLAKASEQALFENYFQQERHRFVHLWADRSQNFGPRWDLERGQEKTARRDAN